MKSPQWGRVVFVCVRNGHNFVGVFRCTSSTMFRKFTEKESVHGTQQLKSSVQRGIRSKVSEQWPSIEPYLEDIWPKKENIKLVSVSAGGFTCTHAFKRGRNNCLTSCCILIERRFFLQIKCEDHTELYAIANTNEILFFKCRDGPITPTLRLLHRYPFLLPLMQVDKGAIKFILSGANVMAPGLISKGGKMSEVNENDTVAVIAEDRPSILAVGTMKMSTKDVELTRKGIAIELSHFVGDGLWYLQTKTLPEE